MSWTDSLTKCDCLIGCSLEWEMLHTALQSGWGTLRWISPYKPKYCFTQGSVTYIIKLKKSSFSHKPEGRLQLQKSGLKENIICLPSSLLCKKKKKLYTWCMLRRFKYLNLKNEPGILLQLSSFLTFSSKKWKSVHYMCKREDWYLRSLSVSSHGVTHLFSMMSRVSFRL